MKKKVAFIIVSVVLLLSMTVSAMALKTGTIELDNTQKVVVYASGTQIKTLCKVGSREYFDGKNPLHITYTKAGSGKKVINGGVPEKVRNAVNAAYSISYSWSSGEAASHSWNITKGDKIGYYNIMYRQKFNVYAYKYYTRVNAEAAYALKWSGNILNKGTNTPYFALYYSKE